MFSSEMKVVRPTRSVSPRSKQVSFTGSAGKSSAPAGASDLDSTATNGVARGGGPNGDLQNLARALNNEPEAIPPDPVDTAPSSSGPVGEPPLKIVADETKNSLLIMANDRDYQRVLRVIQGLDVVASQVLIEAVIAEVTPGRASHGVQWQLAKGGTPTATFSNALQVAGFPRFTTRQCCQYCNNPSALNALTHVNVISTPSMVLTIRRLGCRSASCPLPANSGENCDQCHC